MKGILKSAVRARQRTHQKEAARKTLFQIKESKAAQKQKVYMEGFVREAKRQERRMRKEDWQLGPLAPRHDFGQIEGHFGSSDTNMVHQAPIPKHQRVKHHFFVGDKVAILKGRCKGQIGVIDRIEEDRQEAFIKNTNMLEVRLEDYHRDMVGHDRPFQALEGSIAIADLRLVAKVQIYPNPGRKLVMIDRAVVHHGPDEITRTIAGTNFIVPMPHRVKPGPEKDYVDDTQSIYLDERTYIPRLLAAPMPPSVIDELRSKYSRWRKRFDPDFVEKKMAQDEAKERFTDPDSNNTRTPLQELIAERKKAAVANPRPVVPSEDMLLQMGKLMASKRSARGQAQRNARLNA